MSSLGFTGAQTLLEALAQSLRDELRTPDGVAPPVAVLWTDADGQWQSLVPLLAKSMPQLFRLGAYRPDERCGPVIWLRCVVDRTIAGVPDGAVPVLYLPRVSRQDLRAGGDCPRELQPLIELQYRGAVWHQRNGRDWTVEAFLTSEAGCGLDLAQNMRTREALLRSLPLLAAEPLARLRGRRLDADDFDRLSVGDPIRDLLSWMSDPQGFEARCEPARWQTFRDVCKREFGLDPEAGGPQAAGDALLNDGGAFGAKWESVWRRFAEAPALYPGIGRQLREARPAGLFVARERQPSENEREEESLRRELETVCTLPHAAACEKLLALEARHGERRGWVWARMGESPLALALAPLARLADAAGTSLGGANAAAMAADYAGQGWRCDAAAMEALGLHPGAADAALIARVVRTLYEPWLDRSARRFQELVAGVDARALAVGVTAEKDCCILFADGLRFDVGARLHERLEARGLRSKLSHRIAPLPTVTATAKVMASPAHAEVSGGAGADDFNPSLSASGQALSAQRLRDALARQGVEILEADDNRFAGTGEAGGWCEVGRLDELGHSMGARLVSQIEVEVESLAERIAALLDAGWQKVKIVTDHGWLLLPGGLPKVELPNYLVASRWARCATVRGESATQMPTYPWHWNLQVRIASPPGIACFFANTEYAHGGVSPQECVVPELVVERGQTVVSAKIAAVSWRGMRCKVAVAPQVAGLRADLRLNWKQAESSIAASPKEVTNGEASLACADDRHEGAAATVVLLDAGGHVLDYRPTTVGEN
ncbi:MAG: BREX-1 system phosphatase PglZ type B [Pseudomonadota bacterium]